MVPPVTVDPSLVVTAVASLREVVETMTKNSRQVAAVVDDAGGFVGLVTDGDLRRALLRGATMAESVAQIMNRAPTTAPPEITRAEALALMQRRVIRHLPLVDRDARLVGLLFRDELLDVHALPNVAVLMAGGAGSRLRPLTNDVPKPLLRVGGKPLLEIMIERLRANGVREFYVSVHYRSEQIESHFGDGARLGVRIEYLRESEPLGTAGALRLLGDRWTSPLFLVNGDILTKCDFRSMLGFHERAGAALTVGLVPYTVELPYGVFETDGDRLTAVNEKPRLEFNVNSGLYVMSPALRALIPGGRVFDAPDLIRLAVEGGRAVKMFPITDYWLDVGRHDDFSKADRDVAEGLLD
jgi:dTDP-glucose pyrophosphorylase